MIRILEFSAGLGVTIMVLVDVFATVFVPGPTAGRFSVVVVTRRIGLPVWRRVWRQDVYAVRAGNRFAPFILILSYLAWLLLLLGGYALMMHACRELYRPVLRGASDALYLAGSSMMTLGVSEVDADGIGRWIVLAAALSGFGLITATIGFSAQVQRGMHEREAGVLTLVGMAGSPPSGIVILENFAALGLRDELPAFFLRWRDWAASTLESHAAQPVLVYFGSIEVDIDWIAALESVLDAATLIVTHTDEAACGAATLAHRTGSLAASRLARLFHAELAEPERPRSGSRLHDRLRRAGYRINADPAADERFAVMSADYRVPIAALAAEFGSLRAGGGDTG